MSWIKNLFTRKSTQDQKLDATQKESDDAPLSNSDAGSEQDIVEPQAAQNVTSAPKDEIVTGVNAEGNESLQESTDV